MARRGENIYKRKDGRWEGRYIRGQTPAGKAEYGYVYARSYSACREKCRKQAEALRPVPPPQHNMTMLQATEHFLGKKQDAVKKSTYNRYAYMCKRYILPELGTIQLCTLTADRLSRLFRQLRKKNLSEKSIRDVGVLIKSVLKFARKKLNCSCPACEAPLPACHSKKVEVFTEREITLLAGQIAAEPNLTGLCVLLVLNTGLRLGELCALKKSDIDFTAGILHVERSVQRISGADGTRLTVQTPKSDSSFRSVPVPADMLALLYAAAREIREGAYLLTNKEVPLDPRTMQYRYKALLKRCGVRYRNFHVLRHTYATRCIEKGADIKSVSELLGHADIRTTLQIYVHSSLEHKRQIVESISFLSAATDKKPFCRQNDRQCCGEMACGAALASSSS